MYEESNQKEDDSTPKSKDITETCIPNCQPCDEQGQTNLSTHWCMTCPDFICEGCHAMHMTLRSTRNHVILEINDYKKIGKFLARFDNRCKSHPGEVLNYFCFTHNTACCCICKDKNHNKVCDIQHEDEISDREENCQVLLKNTDMVEKRLCEIDKKIKKNENTFSILHSVRALFEEEIKAGRKQINEFYDKIEANARKKFTKIYSKNQKSLSFQQEQACKQHENFTSIKETMETIKNLHTSKLQTFLIGKYIEEALNEKSQIPDQQIFFKAFNVIPIVKVDTNNQTISFTRGFESSNQLVDNESIRKDAEEYGSSTPEDEMNIDMSFHRNKTEPCTKTTLSDPKKTASCSSKTASVTSDTSLPTNIFVSCKNKAESDTKEIVAETATVLVKAMPIQKRICSPSKDPSKSELEQIKNPLENVTKHVIKLHKECDISGKTMGYQFKNRFHVERRKTGIEIVSIGFMEPDLIVMSEISEDRVLFYRTLGFKKGEIKFKERPGEIAIIEKHKEVVVGVLKMLFFLDSTNQSIKRHAFLYDVIEGVALANDFVFACLYETGIVKLDRLGNILENIPFIKGCLNICMTTNNILYAVKMDNFSNELASFHHSTHTEEIYSMKSSTSRLNGMTCDIQGNVYLSNENSKVFMFDKKTKCFSMILSGGFDISGITSISCSSNAKTFVVACKEGREIKVFEKQNSFES